MYAINRFSKATYSTKQIDAIEKEINNPSDQYAFPSNLLKIMLEDPDKKQLICIIYVLHKRYLQAIDSVKLDKKDVVDEKKQVNDIFLTLFEGIFHLKPVKFSAFDCTMSMNDTLHQETSEFNCVLDKFNSQSLLYKISERKLQQDYKQHDLFTQRSQIALVLIWLLLFLQLAFTKDLSKSFRTILKMLVMITGMAFWKITSLPSPKDTIIDVELGLLNLAYHYMNGKAFTYEPKLAKYQDYFNLFKNNPDASPKTLYEVAHKIMSNCDFYDEIPYKNFENEFLDFLDRQAKNITQDPTQNPELFFPAKEFVMIMIGAPMPWVNYIQWPKENEDLSHRDLAIKNINYLLTRSNFFLPCEEAINKKSSTFGIKK